jgi:hypothetical protein
MLSVVLTDRAWDTLGVPAEERAALQKVLGEYDAGFREWKFKDFPSPAWASKPITVTYERWGLLRGRDGSAPSETQVVRRWLHTWRGVGDVVMGMNRQGYMLHLSNVDATTRRATFSHDAMLSHDGFGAGPPPWRAVQVAAGRH